MWLILSMKWLLFLFFFSPLFATLEDHIPPKCKPNRYVTFKRAFELMKERNVKTIVETGTSRYGAMNCIKDGCSTILFAEWASQNDAHIYSVDIDPQAIKFAKKSLGSLASYVDFHLEDSVSFLSGFNQKIDFLYLDSFDYDRYDPYPSQNHHYREIVAAYPHLSPTSIILIDDHGLPGGGKGKLAIEFLIQRGWRILMDEYQVILVR
jgi:hypothetical protein